MHYYLIFISFLSIQELNGLRKRIFLLIIPFNCA
jgi:hypothetical protein